VRNLIRDEKYLVLREFPDDQAITGNAGLMQQCDLAVMLYDISDKASFANVAKLLSTMKTQYKGSIPTYFVATKADLPAVKQDYSITPERVCDNLKIPHPARVSFKRTSSGSGVAISSSSRAAGNTAAAAAIVDPSDLYNTLHQRILIHYQSSGSRGWAVAVGLLALVACGGVGFYYYKTKK